MNTKDYPLSGFRSPVSAPLRVVFVGHVDHGKSTLIGRILHDTGSLPEGKIEEIKQTCATEGMEFEFAFLLDALLEEQKQNVTIDTTEIPFRTAQRRYAIIDAPGHKEFLKNMITGSSRADAAILVIAANEGVREQSRRHAYLLSMLGIKHLIVVVNKMDLVDYSEERFREIEQSYRKFLFDLGLEARLFIPASAKDGENVARASMKMKWYCRANVLEALDLLEPQKSDVDLPLRFCVQDVYRFDGRRIIGGRIETGALHVGDQLVFSPANKSSVVATIERWNVPANGPAVAGDSIGITLSEQIFVERGYVASHENDTPIETNRFHADLFWIVREPLRVGRFYDLRLATQEVKCQIVSIERIIASSTLESKSDPPSVAATTSEVADGWEQLERNEVGRLTIQTRGPLVMDTMIASRTSGDSSLWKREKSAAAAQFSEGFIPTGRLQRAKIFSGQREKLRHESVPGGVVITVRSFGSRAFLAPGNRLSRRRSSATCSIAACIPTCSTATTSAMV